MVKIVVDSTADLPASVRAQMNVVPLRVIFGEAEYQDGVTITAEKFYEMLVSGDTMPTTSQPSPFLFEDTYRELVEAGHEVVVVTISSRLSGTYQSATIAAEEFPGKVFVVDSRTAALGTGVLAQYALELAEKGMSGQQILEELIEVRKNVRLYAMLDTLEYLKRGGRISATVALVGGVLNVKPLIYVNEEGKIETIGKARGVKKGFAMLNELVEKDGIDEDKPTLLGYTGNSDLQLQDYFAVSQDIWTENTGRCIVGPTVGVHAGPGAVAVAFFKK
jgi:DegV family protein with EDD domain